MSSLVQIISGSLAIGTFIGGILKLISILKISRVEKNLLTDYKKTTTAFLQALMIIGCVSFIGTTIYVIIKPDASAETVASFILVSFLYTSFSLWIIYQFVSFFKKKKTVYYVEDDAGVRYYIHKAISENEIIFSPSINYNNDTTDILIRPKEYLYDKVIKRTTT
ncbi:hypothetical protein [Paenibacillus sp. sgz302251]|uniref:hypothetical protein n=1 Tax=Paenibacillus sp. sgz302251 TaxID=3414493 RepID=UPI003C7BFDA1